MKCRLVGVDFSYQSDSLSINSEIEAVQSVNVLLCLVEQWKIVMLHLLRFREGAGGTIEG